MREASDGRCRRIHVHEFISDFTFFYETFRLWIGGEEKIFFKKKY